MTSWEPSEATTRPGRRFAGASGGTGHLAAGDEAKGHVEHIGDDYREIGGNRKPAPGLRPGPDS
ncbi:hypothetical protein GCM10022252_25360 [Streptosporangium oxazolinicum]|uniref:Uncharacterized protein n=1 Tax=Streptosporangium oxazolinicum TaxID=909287 RepID=A0ABP8ARW5_9ACTN